MLSLLLEAYLPSLFPFGLTWIATDSDGSVHDVGTRKSLEPRLQIFKDLSK